MNNYNAFGEFYIFCLSHGLEVHFDRGDIQARVTFVAPGVSYDGTATVRVSRHSGDKEQVAIQISDEFDVEDVPHGYNADFGRWKHDDGALTITHTHPKHGPYTTKFVFLLAA